MYSSHSFMTINQKQISSSSDLDYISSVLIINAPIILLSINRSPKSTQVNLQNILDFSFSNLSQRIVTCECPNSRYNFLLTLRESLRLALLAPTVGSTTFVIIIKFGTHRGFLFLMLYQVRSGLGYVKVGLDLPPQGQIPQQGLEREEKIPPPYNNPAL